MYALNHYQHLLPLRDTKMGQLKYYVLETRLSYIVYSIADDSMAMVSAAMALI